MDEEKEEKIDPIEVTIKKDKETPEPDYDYDSIDLSASEITGLEEEIDQAIKKRVNKDSI